METGLYIVGIGASAGGLEPLEKFFAEVPKQSGLAYVVIQHLSPDFRSMMDELLSRRTTLPVTVVEDGTEVEPDHIYLIPPKKEMIISSSRLLLRDKSSEHELALPIDVFLRSLARDCGGRAVAVILSGGGSDGSRGIRDVHEAGGLVVCQDETCMFDGMPRSARETGIVDYVIPPNEMPGVIVEHVRRLERGEPSLLEEAAPKGVHAIFRLLLSAYGIDFSHYKPTTILRRIERRQDLGDGAELEAYIERLRGNPEELDALYRDLLIGVTRFFRDGEAFAILEREVIPQILESGAKDEIRVWVPGCATGEEAYSIAMLFHEQMTKANDKRRLKVFATDIHHGSLEFASRGLYDVASCEHVAPERLERYFERQGSMLSVSNELRQLIVFARQNVIKDAPFTRVDLVSCRNMLIYLQPIAQNRALALFQFALRSDGFLFLGPSENPGSLSEDFDVVNQHWRIHRKSREHKVLEGRVSITGKPPRIAARATRTTTAISQTIGLFEALLEESMPSSLVVNERREVVHAFKGAGKWISIRDGRASLDVLELVPPDLKVALAGALRRCLQDKVNLTYDGVRLKLGEATELYKLSVKPIFAKAMSGPHVLVSLEPSGVAASEEATHLTMGDVSHEQVEALETELRFTKENLQTTIEELETSNEELQATNEELLAANEELQSTNEELQSVNEELYTVNAEYQKKIAQLTELTNDIDNLLLSMDVGSIFLDAELRIRKFTPKIARLFNLLPQDLGRRLSGFTNTLDYPDVVKDTETVLGTQTLIEKELCDEQGNWYFLRILPYRAVGETQGVVLTFIDINGLKEAEGALFRERYLFDSLMESVPDTIYFKDGKGKFVRVNAVTAERLGLKRPSLAVGGRASDFLSSDLAWPLEQADIAVLGGETQPYHLEQQRIVSGEQRWFMTTRQPLLNKGGEIVGMYAVARDVTAQKNAEDECRLAVTRRDQFLAMLSHELRNPLGAIVTATRLLSNNVQDGQRREVEILQRQTRQMSRLVDDLLEVTRITHDKIELNKRIVDVRLVTEEGLAALSSNSENLRVSIESNLSQTPVLIHADPARLQQIIVNLVVNAVKYNHDEGHVMVIVRREDAEAVIVVQDDGIGIEPKALESIFELFVQGTSTLARTEGGLGVGLALVRALVRMHGGSVHAASEGPGRGSTFTVRLPLADAHVHSFDDAEIKRAERLSPPDTGRARKEPDSMSIVVVDDNEDSCEMLAAFLESLGCEVSTASDGAAGLDLIERTKPTIALVDIGLPVMDGYVVAQKLRSTHDNDTTRLIALTGYGRSTDREAALRAGFDEHLVKPVEPDRLAALLGRKK